MKPDKKQIPQLIILGLLVMACIGYVSFTVTRSGRHAPPPQSAQQATEQKADNGSADSHAPSARVLAAGVFPSLMAPAAERDPFIPQISPGRDEAPVTAVKPNLPPKPQIPMTNVPPFNPFQGLQTTQAAQQPEVAEPDPDFTLTGVISGEKNVAIIRSGDGGRYIVKQGQIIDGRYKVLSVSEDGAVLADKNRRIHVKLGGAKNAS